MCLPNISLAHSIVWDASVHSSTKRIYRVSCHHNPNMYIFVICCTCSLVSTIWIWLRIITIGPIRCPHTQIDPNMRTFGIAAYGVNIYRGECKVAGICVRCGCFICERLICGWFMCGLGRVCCVSFAPPSRNLRYVSKSLRPERCELHIHQQQTLSAESIFPQEKSRDDVSQNSMPIFVSFVFGSTELDYYIKTFLWLSLRYINFNYVFNLLESFAHV